MFQRGASYHPGITERCEAFSGTALRAWGTLRDSIIANPMSGKFYHQDAGGQYFKVFATYYSEPGVKRYILVGYRLNPGGSIRFLCINDACEVEWHEDLSAL